MSDGKSTQALKTQARANALHNSYWTFSEIGIEPGAELTFVKDETKKCKVVGDREVEYEGENFDSLVDFARKHCQFDAQWNSAPGLFRYGKKLLSDLRKE